MSQRGAKSTFDHCDWQKMNTVPFPHSVGLWIDERCRPRSTAVRVCSLSRVTRRLGGSSWLVQNTDALQVPISIVSLVSPPQRVSLPGSFSLNFANRSFFPRAVFVVILLKRRGTSRRRCVTVRRFRSVRRRHGKPGRSTGT